MAQLAGVLQPTGAIRLTFQLLGTWGVDQRWAVSVSQIKLSYP